MSSSVPEVLAQVLPLALGAAVSPVILLVQMATLTSGTARLARAWAVAAGTAVAITGWGLAGWVLVNRLPTPRTGPDATAAAVDLALAFVLVALGLRSLSQRHDPPHAPAARESTGGAHVAASFAVGLVAMATNVTTVVLFLPAVRDVARAELPLAGTAVVLAVLLVIVTMPAWLPVLAVSLGGAAGRRLLDRVGAFATRHHALIAAVVSFGFALYLGWNGLRRL
jgi:hypothetical protein